MKKATLILIALLCIATGVYAQKSFKAQQKEQERAIKAAYKRHKVTQREYYKLMDEQDAIKYAIEKYEADGYWTLHEKDVVRGKLERAHDRLRRYKTNGERY
ncbi:MAG: hypothetical protein BGO69_16575 [Bacteroidetes bacterium 46-16]|nr:MAG: hypothetical protein BGO69_16575 [Bacteroidetes bacterium 46-16]